MKPFSICFESITPVFSYGAHNKKPEQPEIRVPSIRGMLRWWSDALLGCEKTKAIFGGTGEPPVASGITVRVTDLKTQQGRQDLLPHPCDHHSPKNAILDGSRWSLMFSSRTNGKVWKEADFVRVLHAWLLLGGLGGRSNRGAGSFCWNSDRKDLINPSGVEDYQKKIDELLEGSPIRACVLKGEETTAEDAREVVSNTVSGGVGNNALGNIDPRTPSPLKFRIIKIGDTYCIVAVWDGRNRKDEGRGDLKLAIDELCRKTSLHGVKEIGVLLQASALYQWCCG